MPVLDLLDAVRVDDSLEDPSERQLSGLGRRPLESLGDSAGQDRPDAHAHAALEDLEGQRHAVLEARLGQEPLDRELEVVELVEAEVEPIADPAQDEPDDRVPSASDGRYELDSVRHVRWGPG